MRFNPLRLRAMLPIAFAMLVSCGAYHAAEATEYYVSPNAPVNGDGSVERPWSLQVALSQPGTVGPDDTIWLQGGVYTKGRTPGVGGPPINNETFTSDLTGEPGRASATPHQAARVRSSSARGSCPPRR